MAQTKAGISCSRHLIMQATMVVFTFIFFAAKPARSVTTQSSDQATVIEMHGSGTTNPSKYFWKAMDRLEERARKPVRMTYRGVGSGTGQVEFIGYDQATATTQGTNVDVTNPVSDFGSADIPLSATQYGYFASSVPVRRGEFFSQRRRG
jgi:ABC-type phosphate transport system substrate-binding protein